MQTYLVGGAVRDRLLGLPVTDRDWLVVGATPEEMVRRGYLPVGRDFPVFLHPRTREEHALARTERKSAPGYRGFTVHASPDVTVEQDLARRDLTINAIALPSELADAPEADPAALVDPYHGRQDLDDKVLRHVTEAFREDPVRILRVARFAARFHDFRVAPETMALMRDMVAAGEVDALVPERVWQELSRGLMEAAPSRMLTVLQDCGALPRLLPELTADTGRLQVIDRAAEHGMPLPVRFACLTRGLGAALAAFCERWRVPTDERDLALLVDREGAAVDAGSGLDADGIVALFERCDAFRKPARFAHALQACACAKADAGEDARERLRSALAAAQAVETEAIAQAAQMAGQRGPEVGKAIRAARVAAVAALA